MNTNKWATWTREECIEWLSDHDRNGDYSDEQVIAQGLKPLTLIEARRLVYEALKELETDGQ